MTNKEPEKSTEKKLDYIISLDSVVAKYSTEFLLEATDHDVTICFGQRNPSNANAIAVFSRIVIPHKRVDALIDLLKKHNNVGKQKKKRK